MGARAIGRTMNNANPNWRADRSRYACIMARLIATTNRRPAVSITSQYDDFLFAPLWDEQGGMRLSVLSAFARMNVDPWEEAARLSDLTASEAERTLVSTLGTFPGNRQSSSDTQILAARLVALLPKARPATTSAVATSGMAERQVIYWLVWLCIGIALSFASPLQHATTIGVDDSNSQSLAIHPAAGEGAGPAPSGTRKRPDFVVGRARAVPSADDRVAPTGVGQQ